jgi:hypothetical protein
LATPFSLEFYIKAALQSFGTVALFFLGGDDDNKQRIDEVV